jgi:hypothetical protein
LAIPVIRNVKNRHELAFPATYPCSGQTTQPTRTDTSMTVDRICVSEQGIADSSALVQIDMIHLMNTARFTGKASYSIPSCSSAGERWATTPRA